MNKFLPVNKKDLEQRGIKQLDVIIVTGDAYVDHPSFGPVLIARHLEAHGFTVGIIPQPGWEKDEDFQKLGTPRLFFGVSAGNLDSMVAHYTADKEIRHTDMYSPNNEAGHRPDRATIVYAKKLKQLFPGVPIVLGGVEASLRRLAHYDYWDDKVRRSILFDTRADDLVYGMGERGILSLAENLKLQTSNFQTNPNTAIIRKEISEYKDALILPSYEEVVSDKKKYAEAFRLYYFEGRKRHPRIIIQPCQGRYLVVFPPQNLTQKELEALYELPFARAPHPMYKGKKIPAWDFVKFSTVSHRGCFGGCSFCAISQHQGKYIVSRSLKSIKKEVRNAIMKQPDFKGNILDVGGPTSNMYMMECRKKQGCTRASCIYPNVCKNLNSSLKPSLRLLREIRSIPGVKNLFISSGIRYDLALLDDEYIEEVVRHHVRGQLCVAPEHFCDEVLLMMGKPKADKFLQFKNKFEKFCKKYGKKQFLVPYIVSSHPGCTLQHTLNLIFFLKKHKIRFEQVADFTPTPMTISTCMYYTGMNPFTRKIVHVPKEQERSFQRALFQPRPEKNHRFVMNALKLMGQKDFVRDLTPSSKG